MAGVLCESGEFELCPDDENAHKKSKNGCARHYVGKVFTMDIIVEQHKADKNNGHQCSQQQSILEHIYPRYFFGATSPKRLLREAKAISALSIS